VTLCNIPRADGLPEHYLLQLEELKSSASMQVPFHRDGIGPISLSLKLSDSGQIPILHSR
jgi:hypothetical protein